MTTKRILAALPLPVLALLAACVPAPVPTPTPAPAPAPAPAPPPPQASAPAPPSSNWADVPQTPGDWSYAAGTARFGPPGGAGDLVLRCDRAGGAVEIARAAQGPAQAVMIVRTEFMARSLAAGPVSSPLPAITARIAATDPLLDAMAFSKGRFAVEVAGLPTLYVPSYPEVTRVIEDCR